MENAIEANAILEERRWGKVDGELNHSSILELEWEPRRMGADGVGAPRRWLGFMMTNGDDAHGIAGDGK
jgi:hypothetical protein